MKIKILIVMVLTGCLSITQSNAQSRNISQKHFLNFGPQVSYNLEQKIVLVGGGIGYEYRLHKNGALQLTLTITQALATRIIHQAII